MAQHTQPPVDCLPRETDSPIPGPALRMKQRPISVGLVVASLVGSAVLTVGAHWPISSSLTGNGDARREPRSLSRSKAEHELAIEHKLPRPLPATEQAASQGQLVLPAPAANVVAELSSSGVDNGSTHALLDDSIGKWKVALGSGMSERLQIEPWSCFQAGCFLIARLSDQQAYDVLNQRFAAEQPLGSTVWSASWSRPLPIEGGGVLTVWVADPKRSLARADDN